LRRFAYAPAPLPLREHGEVVVVFGDDLLAEPLEREARHRFDEPVVALAGSARMSRASRSSSLGGSGLLEAGEERAPRATRPQRASASFETPTNGEASTDRSAVSS
jgi:hypothetical protein